MQISGRAQKFLDTHCHMCNTAIKPKRQNKSGPRYCGNTCRQRAFRLKHNDWTTEKPMGTFVHLQEQLRRSQDLAHDASERARTNLDKRSTAKKLGEGWCADGPERPSGPCEQRHPSRRRQSVAVGRSVNARLRSRPETALPAGTDGVLQKG